MDKFLLAQNPMKEYSSGIFLIHLLDPIAIIQCTSDDGPPIQSKVFKEFMHEGITWKLSIYFIEKEIGNADHLISRAWRWFRSYLENK